MQDETRFSYLARVAAANHVPERNLWGRLSARPPETDEDPLVYSRWVAAACGIDLQRLLSAVSELQVGSNGPDGRLPVTGRPLPRRARQAPPCRFCAACRGAIPDRDVDPDWALEPEVWLSVEDNVCRRHRVWIGPGVTCYAQQLDLTRLPEVVQAQTRHHRLVRRRGRREVFLAYTDAARIWWKLAWLHDCVTERDQRIGRCLGADIDPEDLDVDDPLRHAAIYPETVALTALLASPFWRKQALSPRPAAREAFHEEFTRRVTPHHPHPGQLDHLLREHLTAPDRRHRISDRQP